MAVISRFSAAWGSFVTLGDGSNDDVVVSRNAAGNLLVNGGAVPVIGGAPTAANVRLIQLLGQAGDDVLRLDETNGALPAAQLQGGDGNDALTGGSGNDTLTGGTGHDSLFGRGGVDLLNGDAGNDVLVGGDGNDQMFGGAGDDRLVWNPGDDSDLFEGGDGSDTAEVNGGNGAEQFTITANGTRVRFDRVDPAPFTLDIGSTEKLVLNANGGDDVVTVGNGLSTLIRLTVDGGAGNDTLTGGDGADLLLGGDGSDLVTGGRGADTALLGSGDDRFVWSPGDGSDVVEGQAGTDTLQFNGANINEIFDIGANGGRVLFTRNVANIAMDLNDVEHIALRTLGGADLVTVGDAAGTGLTDVAVDLAATGGVDDGAADTVAVTGTADNDNVQVASTGTAAAVVGLPARVDLSGIGVSDGLQVQGGAGADTLDASQTQATALRLVLDGGTGNDDLRGGAGADLLLGGDDNDTVSGGRGNDVALLGSGDDRFTWNPGDGNDVIEGQDGFDTLAFNGANINEVFDISANGGRVLLLRDVASITMDQNDVEAIELLALGGSDRITIGDLAGTDVQQLAIGLRGAAGGGDGAADTVAVLGSPADDAIAVLAGNGSARVTGMGRQVQVQDFEAGSDQLRIDGQAGNDVIDASAATAPLQLLGGDGVDLLVGGSAGDSVTGGRGNDTALMGGGDDRFTWNPGDGSDIIEGQAGFDTQAFNGANINELFDIHANGGRVVLTRNVAAITMDQNDVERIELATLGGADTVNVGDLSGTDMLELVIDLRGGGGGGDGAADTVTLKGTAGDDVVVVAMQGGDLVVTGLASTVVVRGFEPGIDHLLIQALAGDDVIDGSAATLPLELFGGDGDDILLGGSSDDQLFGDLGDDILVGNAGLDLLDGGPGNNVLIQ